MIHALKALGEIDKETYVEVKNELVQQQSNIIKQMNEIVIDTSNLENYIDQSFDIAQNINKYWQSESIEIKKRIQELVFPGGLSFDAQKREYLTRKVNTVFSLIREISGVSEGRKKNNPENFPELSSVVAGKRIELLTSGL